MIRVACLFRLLQKIVSLTPWREEPTDGILRTLVWRWLDGLGDDGSVKRGTDTAEGNNISTKEIPGP